MCLVCVDMPSSSFSLPQPQVKISNGRPAQKEKNPKVSVRVNSVKYDKYVSHSYSLSYPRVDFRVHQMIRVKNVQ